ncbi:Pentatricopeptide repeat-containing protein [Canna indica]|uniref:Pentatricopeptide repeat-containing protein n=1 Tax=Canna indica TaxID=4628 RepID=A0AAQ3QMW7_9LILI|nr:Pentatricopeptide repeat-containing protein [Canna indica]
MDTATKNSLITMYSNCGCIQEARRVFNSLENPNLISFNSMISACAQHGFPEEAVELFERLRVIGLQPDEITILNLLSAFNHAVRVIRDMPFKPDSSLWRIVLGACSKHQNVGVGKKIAELLLELEPREATNYVLLANTYARSGKWVQAERVDALSAAIFLLWVADRLAHRETAMLQLESAGGWFPSLALRSSSDTHHYQIFHQPSIFCFSNSIINSIVVGLHSHD